jgi:hypothetical protein
MDKNQADEVIRLLERIAESLQEIAKLPMTPEST